MDAITRDEKLLLLAALGDYVNANDAAIKKKRGKDERYVKLLVRNRSEAIQLSTKLSRSLNGA